jgi:hypothetical protein
METETGD